MSDYKYKELETVYVEAQIVKVHKDGSVNLHFPHVFGDTEESDHTIYNYDAEGVISEQKYNDGVVLNFSDNHEGGYVTTNPLDS